MSGIWDRFDGIANKDEVEKAKSQFTPIAPGEYECELESIEAGESQNYLPMIKGKFKKLDGSGYIFYNQLLQNVNKPEMTAVNIADAVQFISDLTGEEIVFNSMSQFGDIVGGIKFGDHYLIKVSYGTKDVDHKFPKLKCVKKLEPDIPLEPLPFNL